MKASFYCHVVLSLVIFNKINYFKKTFQQVYITSDWIKIFSIYLQLGYKIYLYKRILLRKVFNRESNNNLMISELPPFISKSFKPVLSSRRFHILQQLQNKALIILILFFLSKINLASYLQDILEFPDSCVILCMADKTRNDMYYLLKHENVNIYIF